MTYKQVAAPASPVESVGVPALPLRAFQMSGKGGYVILMDDEGRNIASISDRFGADARMKIAESLADGVNSHAAKDAKIAKLEAAVLDLISLIEEKDQKSLRIHPFEDLVVAARAALALPCAPQGS